MSTLGWQDGRFESRRLFLKRGHPSRANALRIDFRFKSDLVRLEEIGGRAGEIMGVCGVIEVLDGP